MKIFTTYFENIHNLTTNIMVINICPTPPSGFRNNTYPRYKIITKNYRALTPDIGVYRLWRQHKIGDEKFAQYYQKHILDKLDVKTVVRELEKLSYGENIALVTHERPDEFSYRHMVSDWIANNYYTKPREFTYVKPRKISKERQMREEHEKELRRILSIDW